MYKVKPLAKPVAIKKINLPKREWTNEHQQGYSQEIKGLKLMKENPFVLRFIEDFEDAGKANIVMEYASGGSLHKRLSIIKELGGRLTKEKALKIFTMICLGMLSL